MKINLRKSFVLLATAFMFSLLLSSCSKEELNQDGGGSGGGGGRPAETKSLVN